MDFEKLKVKLQDQPAFRWKQVLQSIFQNLITTWNECTNLSKDLREELTKEVSLHIDAELFTSEGGDSVKALITLHDGKQVEAVLMRYKNGKNVVCVSCQVGCPMGCDFCATGKMGFLRNLTSFEVLLQVLVFARFVKKENQRITNVVFMGMGEPFLNYDEVMGAISMLNDKKYFHIGARHMTVSTCGVIEGIHKFMNENIQVKLAVSLHAPNDTIRSQIMPVNKKYNLVEVLKTLNKYVEKTGRKIMIEYTLLRGINDEEIHAMELSEQLKTYVKRLFMVNLIAYNPTEKYQSPSNEVIQKFRRVLEREGIEVTQRFKLGRAVKGGCGQLASNK